MCAHCVWGEGGGGGEGAETQTEAGSLVLKLCSRHGRDVRALYAQGVLEGRTQGGKGNRDMEGRQGVRGEGDKGRMQTVRVLLLLLL